MPAQARRRRPNGEISTAQRWHAEWRDDHGARVQATAATRAQVTERIRAAGLQPGKHGVRVSAFWYAQTELPRDPVTGKRRRITTYGPTQADALAAARAAKDAHDDAQARGLRPVLDTGATLNDWLDHWFAHPGERKASTQRAYESLARVHVRPALGALGLRQVRPRHVEELLGAMAAAGLKSATRAAVRRMLSSVFADAVRADMVPDNPITAARGPSLNDKRRGVALDEAQVSGLLAAARSTPWDAFVTIAAGLGLRKGELLALRWDAVDVDAATIAVVGTLSAVPGGGGVEVTVPKTESSVRTVPAPPVVLAALERHRRAQELARAQAGERWVETGFVFTTSTGTPWHPQSAQKAVGALLAAAGLDGVRLHDLRHTALTALYRASDVKTAATVAGHAGTGVTSAVYLHPRVEDLRPAVEAAARAIDA
jgi:integrase